MSISPEIYQREMWEVLLGLLRIQKIPDGIISAGRGFFERPKVNSVNFIRNFDPKEN